VRSALQNVLEIGVLLEQGDPALFELSQISAADPARQKLACSRLQSRFWRRRFTVQLLERLPPPGDLDRRECRLRGAADRRAQRIVNVE
jgi:hypothetical protein